jgi:uncharacterized membrane protein YfcA
LSIEVILILLITGIAAGILSGLFGVGGGIVIVPSLIFIYGLIGFNSPHLVHTAIATSLFTIIFTSFSSALKHFENKNILLKTALIIGLASAVSVFLVSKAAINLPGDTLKKIFALIIILVGIRMLLQRTKAEQENGGNTVKDNYFITIIVGVLSGAVAAFTGLGGGVFIIPLMHYVQKIPIKKAIGTSTAAIFITSIAGVISYIINVPSEYIPPHFSFGMIDVLASIPIIAASIPSAQLGVYIHNKTHHSVIGKIFGAFLLLVAVRMLFA